MQAFRIFFSNFSEIHSWIVGRSQKLQKKTKRPSLYFGDSRPFKVSYVDATKKI